MTGQARPALGRYAWLSIGVALAIIALKDTAYRLTDSVGLLSRSWWPRTSSGPD